MVSETFHRWMWQLGDAISIDVRKSASIASTALHEAAAENRVGSIRVLIEAGADVHARDMFDWTPLHRASTGRPEAVPTLLEHGTLVLTRRGRMENHLFTWLHQTLERSAS